MKRPDEKIYHILAVFKRLKNNQKKFIFSVPDDTSAWRKEDKTLFKMNPYAGITKYLQITKLTGKFVVECHGLEVQEITI